MKKNLSHLIFILDRSGSMGGLEDETIKGYNSVIEQQSKLDGSLKVTTVLFDNEIEEVFSEKSPEEAKLDRNKYYVRGSTAMLDAIGITLSKVMGKNAKLKEEERPDNIIVAITTDGYENASREYSYKQINDLISKCKKNGWKFIFLSSEIDEQKVGGAIGLSKDEIVQSFEKTSCGMRKMSNVLCKEVTRLRNK